MSSRPKIAIFVIAYNAVRHLVRTIERIPPEVETKVDEIFIIDDASSDNTYYAALGRIEGKPYATLICAGSDGENAARQITRIATGWRLRPVAAPLIICTHAQTPEVILAPKTIGKGDLEQCREIGATIAAGLAFGIY